MKCETTAICLIVSFVAAFAGPAKASQFEPAPISSPTNSRKDLFQIDMFPGWFKPRCKTHSYKGSSRLVVKLMQNGSAILNPKDEGFGWSSNTIELKGLSLKNAELLWGKPRGITFDLLAEPSLRSADTDIFHLDTKFVDDELASYRLRGIDITKPEWVAVD